MKTPTCLRCLDAELLAVASPAGLSFFECPGCGRRFAQRDGGPLTERWLGPLRVTLYGVLFSRHPQAEAARVAAMITSAHAGSRDLFIREIRAELASPSQPVRDILPGMSATEEDLREFLRSVADALEAAQ